MEKIPIIINVIISFFIAVITAYFTARATYDFNEKENRKKLVIEKNYDTFVNLRNNLKEFFTDVTEKYDFFSYLTENKKLLKDIKNRLKTNLTEYTKKQETEGLYCNYNKIETYLGCIEKFEKSFLSDISEVAGLSHPDIKKIATKIENIYLAAKKGECLFFESLQDELGQEELENKIDKYSGYISFKKDAYWGECWLQILPLLKNLQNNLDEAVDLRKI